MEDDKYHGLDSFPYEFYKATWEFFAPDLLCVYKDPLRHHSPSAEINKGLIKFIHKERDLKVIMNW
jgi:hypothetical protein